MSESSVVFDRLHACVVSPLAPELGPLSHQAELLCAHLQKEGAQVSQVDTDVPAVRRLAVVGPFLLLLVRWLVLLVRMFWVVPRCRVVHVLAAHQEDFFLPVILALFLGRLLRQRVVVSLYGTESPRLLQQRDRLAWPMLRSLDRFTVSSRYVGEVFGHYGLDPILLPALLDQDRHPFVSRNAWPPRLLWVDDLDPSANPAMALEAFARLRQAIPEARMLLVGTGSLAGQVADLARRLDVADAIAYRPRLPEHKRQQLLQQASVVWHTAREADLPVMLLEAAATGAVIVSTEVGAIPELLINGVDGLLVAQDDAEAMAAATTQVLRRAVLADGLAKNARLAMERFTWASLRQDVARLYGLAGDPVDLADQEEPVEMARVEYLRPETDPILQRGAGRVPTWANRELDHRAELLRADPSHAAEPDGTPPASHTTGDDSNGSRRSRRR